MLLIVTFCLGLACYDAEYPVEAATVLPHNCVAALGEVAPSYIAKHPGFEVRRWKCVPIERLERDA